MPVALRQPRVAHLALALGLGVLLTLGACSDDDSDPAQTGAPPSSTTTTTAPAEAEPLQILVTNDDGYDAEGIDAVVEALSGLEGVEIDVVAPLEQQSGTGGTFTDGPVETSEVQTLSGVDAVAVDGYPSDSVRVAIDEMGLEPDLVVSGINEGQNLGPVVDVSGTIGAGRAAVARGIPALAVSSGTSGFDYASAAEIVIEWVEENRDAVAAGDAAVEVTSVNVPSCDAGEVRGLLEVPVATGGNPLAAQDCTSTLEDPADDVEAFTNGFATLTVVPDEPAVPPTAGA